MKYIQTDQIKLKRKLDECCNIDIKNVDINDVEDISNIKINKEKSSIERILDFLDTCKNPYLFKVDDVIVQIGFSDNSNIDATECVSRALKKEFIK